MSCPAVSVVIPTLDSQRVLEACLSSLRGQNIGQENVEILIVDGGSRDSTKQIAESYGCRIINGGYRENQEARKSIGLFESKNELVAYIDSDNILPGSDWMTEMIKPFVEHPETVAAQTWRYGIKPGFNAYNRYCALIGANDPVPFYLGKSEKLCYLFDDWRATSIMRECHGYFLVNFTPENLPTVGGNGFFIRREILIQSRCQPDEFFHIDVISDLVRAGHNPFAMVRNEIYHDVTSRLRDLALRRMKYFMIHSPSRSARRYFVFDVHKKKDIIKLLLYVIFTLTLVQPLFLSIRGYLKKKDTAWFLHPYVCWSFLIAYSISSLVLYARVLRIRISREFSD